MHTLSNMPINIHTELFNSKQCWKITQIQELLFLAGSGHKSLQKANSSASYTFTVFLCLPPCLTSSPCLSLPPYTFPHPCIHAAVKVVPDECSFETSQAVGTSRRLLYGCGFLVKLQISPVSRHVQYLRLYPSTLWWLAGIVTFFKTTIFSSGISINFNWWFSINYRPRGKIF